MEPHASQRQNKLVYVVAFEEDGYARDVTARYTRQLHTRVARMRPSDDTQTGGPGLSGPFIGPKNLTVMLWKTWNCKTRRVVSLCLPVQALLKITQCTFLSAICTATR